VKLKLFGLTATKSLRCQPLLHTKAGKKTKGRTIHNKNLDVQTMQYMSAADASITISELASSVIIEKEPKKTPLPGMETTGQCK
jgi:hypothetical protein